MKTEEKLCKHDQDIVQINHDLKELKYNLIQVMSDIEQSRSDIRTLENRLDRSKQRSLFSGIRFIRFILNLVGFLALIFILSTLTHVLNKSDQLRRMAMHNTKSIFQ